MPVTLGFKRLQGNGKFSGDPLKPKLYAGGQKMKKMMAVICLFVSAICFTSTAAFSEGMPSSKSGGAVVFDGLAVMNSNAAAAYSATDVDGWTTVISTSLKCANQKDLIVNPSFECGLYTDTTVKSKGGVRDTSSASASIRVRVIMDGIVHAEPDGDGLGVAYCERSQTLTAVLQGIINDIILVDGVPVIDETTLTEEEIGLVLETLSSHSFNFIIPNVSSGDHTIEVQAKISTDAAWQNGSAEASAVIGKGAVVVDEVRFIKGDVSDIIYLP